MNAFLKIIRSLTVIVAIFIEGAIVFIGALLGLMGILVLITLAFALCLLPLLPFVLR